MRGAGRETSRAPAAARHDRPADEAVEKGPTGFGLVAGGPGPAGSSSRRMGIRSTKLRDCFCRRRCRFARSVVAVLRGFGRSDRSANVTEDAAGGQ